MFLLVSHISHTQDGYFTRGDGRMKTKWGKMFICVTDFFLSVPFFHCGSIPVLARMRPTKHTYNAKKMGKFDVKAMYYYHYYH